MATCLNQAYAKSKWYMVIDDKEAKTPIDKEAAKSINLEMMLP